MRITLNKFGTILTSRQSGREAYAAFQPTLHALPKDQPVEIDFDGIVALSPSWADEFLTPLRTVFGERLLLLASANSSVRGTVEFIESITGAKYRWSA